MSLVPRNDSTIRTKVREDRETENGGDFSWEASVCKGKQPKRRVPGNSRVGEIEVVSSYMRISALPDSIHIGGVRTTGSFTKREDSVRGCHGESLYANPNSMKTLDSCTVHAQREHLLTEVSEASAAYRGQSLRQPVRQPQ
jgi:hypothetical protein